MGAVDFIWRKWPATRKLVEAFAGRPLRFVGGCVRDGLLSRDVTDVDVATPLLSAEVSALMIAAGHKVVPTGIAHGTVTAVIDGKGFEITTLRSDTACDGRHAKVVFTDRWQDDAARRDFTMNTLYCSPEGELFDYFGGAEDARAGVVRFIGDADLRIREDYLRILRFFRFYAHYGKGAPDAASLAACAAQAEHIRSLSGERIQHEMFKLLASPRASSVLKCMRQTGVLREVMAQDLDLAPVGALEQGGLLSVPDPVVTLAVFLRGAPDPAQACDALVARWKCSAARSKRLKRLCTEPLPLLTISQAEQRQLIRTLGANDFSDLARLAAAFMPEHKAAFAAMIAQAQQWNIPEFPIKGADLVALGVAPGEALGKLLSTLEGQWEASGYAMSKQELLAGAEYLFSP